MKKSLTVSFVCAVLLMVMGTAWAQDTVTADLDSVKGFALEHAAALKEATADYAANAADYYALIEAANFDYAAAWDANAEALQALIQAAKDNWLLASLHYETDEGIVAGVPSLSYYDVWLDAGPSGAEDPENALEWTLELPNGESLENPGNFFHHLTEPALWGTNADFVGLAVDLDGDGETGIGEVLPEANIFLGAAQGIDDAAAEMLTTIDAWEPTLEDAFTAMVIMVPTMSEYFEQWKLSAFVSENPEEQSFVAVSRLFDINGILTGLSVTYDQVGPLVAQQNPELHAQIDVGFSTLTTYVSTLYDQEQSGKVFKAEEAELFGTEAQNRAETLTALITQASDALKLTLELE